MLEWLTRWRGRAHFLRLCAAFLCALTIAPLDFTGKAFAQSTSIIGTWHFVWEGARDNYTGTLNVTTKIADHVFNGKLHLVRSSGAAVNEDASITVTGNEVRIECSNPSEKKYFPDRFYVTSEGNRMEGYSLDAGGQRGKKIVFTRR
ncbi:MAG: hypothetical protein ACLQJ0_02130 [Steroidobacteraceae bacterium]